MIGISTSVQGFQSTPGAAEAWATFLSSPQGRLLIEALRSAHPATLLGDGLNSPQKLRDSAIVDGSVEGVTQNLLGKISGFEHALNVLHQLSKPVGEAPESNRQTDKVSRVLRTPRTHG